MGEIRILNQLKSTPHTIEFTNDQRRHFLSQGDILSSISDIGYDLNYLKSFASSPGMNSSIITDIERIWQIASEAGIVSNIPGIEMSLQTSINEYPILASGDDGFASQIGTAKFEDTHSQIHFGYSSWVAYPWLRFQLPFAQGTPIISADIEVKAQTTDSNAMSLNWYIEDVENSAQLADLTDFWARIRNSVPVLWTPGTWNGNTSNLISGLAPLVQHAIDKPGWVAGNYIQFFGHYASGSSQSSRICHSFDEWGEPEPKLVIESVT